MLLPRCKTCGKRLAHLQLPYENKLQKICNNPNLTDEQKDDQKIKLINSFGLNRYCCKKQLLTYIDTINIIK